MPIPTGLLFTAQRPMSRIVEVCCSQCSQTYYYELVRVGIGHGQSPLGLMNTRAKAEAQADAEFFARYRTTREHDPVPCPFCGWVQDEAIVSLRERRYPWLVGLAYGMLLIFILFPLWMVIKQGAGKSYQDTLVLVGIAGIGVALAAGFLMLLKWRQSRFGRASFDTLPPWHSDKLAPPALVPNAEGTALVPAKPVELPRRGASIIVQIHRAALPVICYGCGGVAIAQFRPAIAMDADNATFPCCGACQTTLIMKWWAVAFLAFAACAAATVGGISLPWGAKAEVRWMLGLIIGIPVTLALTIVASNLLTQPLSHGEVDKTRGWVRLRIRNAELAKQVAALFTDPGTYEVAVSEQNDEQTHA